MREHFDTIILGGGPAGLTAGMYLARAKMRVLIIDSGTVGGQTIMTHAIANYPGLEDIAGYQLAATMKQQAQNFGCTIVSHASIGRIGLEGSVKTLWLGDGSEYHADSVIIATGGLPRNLGIDSEATFTSRGISYCSTCDGDFFTGRDIVVIGGGNSALEEAVSLTAYARSVTILHQFDHFQAMPHYVEEARNNDRIAFVMNVEVLAFSGDAKLERVHVRDNATGETRDIPADGAFIFIGYAPNTTLFAGVVSLNDNGAIETDDELRTNIDGVWAAGDVRDKKYRQITTAVSDGTIAALSVLEYLSQRRAAA